MTDNPDGTEKEVSQEEDIGNKVIISLKINKNRKLIQCLLYASCIVKQQNLI